MTKEDRASVCLDSLEHEAVSYEDEVAITDRVNEVERDVREINKSLEKFGNTLDKVSNQLNELSQRLAKVEAKAGWSSHPLLIVACGVFVTYLSWLGYTVVQNKVAIATFQKAQVEEVFSKKTTSAKELINPAAVTYAAATARRNKIAVSPAQILDIALPLLSNANNANWQAATALLNLRSYVNSTLQDALKQIGAVMDANDHGKWHSVRRTEWLLVKNQDLILDGQSGETHIMMDKPGHPMSDYHNMIFRNCHIHYRGGAVTLYNVFFVNCTFDVDNNANGIRLAESILNQTFVNFKVA